ncbi:MAG TPA: chloride channel protein [Geobacteraceae bacterium]
MKPRLSEQLTLFASIVKWSAYASVVGALAGSGTALFLKTLAKGTTIAAAAPDYQFFLPLFLLASSALVRYLAPGAAGHGTEKVIEAVHQHMGYIPFRVVPVKLVATVVTLASGGSAGKEGPCAQIGAGLASVFASVIRLPEAERKKLVICGISAGFATVFGTPIAGALFGIEVLVLGQVMYDVLLPSFVAGIVGYHVATSLGITYYHDSISIVSGMTGRGFLEMLLLGVWCGLVALLFIQLLHVMHSQLGRLFRHWIASALIGGVLLVLIGRFVSWNYLGLGLGTIETGLRGEHLPAGALFWKSITTAITLGCGGSGGVLTPVFFVGTAAGNLFAFLFHEPNVAAFSAIGMVAVLAAAANTPISASVMAMEMFGSNIGPHAAVACVVSFLIVGYHSVYPSQLLGIQKSDSLLAPAGSQLGEIEHAVVTPREKSLLAALIAVWQRVKPPKGPET